MATQYKRVTPSVMAQPQGLQRPSALMLGLQKPADVKKNKDQMLKVMDQQLDHEIKGLELKMKNEVSMLEAKSEQQKKTFIMNLDMDTTKTKNQLQQQFEEDKMNLQQECSKAKAQLERETMKAIVEFEQNSAREDMERTQIAMADKASKMQKQFDEEFQKLSKNQPNSVQGTVMGMTPPNGVATPMIRGANLQNMEVIAHTANRSRLDLTRMPGYEKTLRKSYSRSSSSRNLLNRSRTSEFK